MKKALFLLGALICTVGCKIGDKPYKVTYQNFIWRYGQAFQLSLEEKKSGEEMTSETAPARALRLNVDTWLHWWAGGDLEFWEIAKRNGDACYNHTVWKRTPDDDYRPSCFAEQFNAIHVTSDAVWDDAHPAGIPLDDILWFEGRSVAPYVHSGYTADPMYTEIGKRLSEVTKDDLQMLVIQEEHGFPEPRIWFMTTPTHARKHVLTVLWTTKDGVTKEAKIICTPEVSAVFSNS